MMKLDFNFNFGAALLAAITCIPSLSAAAAVDQASTVRGIVADSSGAAVVGAEVRVVSGDTSRTAVTDGRGGFAVDGIPPGAARVTVTSPGFAPVDAEVKNRGKA